MIELRVTFPDRTESIFRFDKTEVVVGRKPMNDVVLPNAGVSSRHLRIFSDAAGVWVEDQNSTNGTLVNGVKIAAPFLLAASDLITIGEFRIALLVDTARLLDSDIPELELSIPDGRAFEPTPANPLELAPGSAPLGGASWVPPLESARVMPSIEVPRAVRQEMERAHERKAAPHDEHRKRSARATRSQQMAVPPELLGAPMGEGVGGAVSSPGHMGSLLEFPSFDAARPAFHEPSVPAAPPPAPRRTQPSFQPPPVAKPPPPPAYKPPPPRDIDSTGIRRSALIDLLLKHVYFAGEISGLDLAHHLRLPFSAVLEPLLGDLRRDKLLDIKGGGSNFGMASMVFTVTAKGSESIRQILDRNRYCGPAPVTMEEYQKGVAAQSIRRCRVPKQRLVKEFNHLVVDDRVFDGIGPAMNSGTAILFYGPPGNGKTAICQAMINCIDDAIYIPYAIEVDGNIIQVYDEHNHKPVSYQNGDELEYDQRYVKCHRPLIMVGGELTLDMLDMSYSTEARYYEAPFQMKANGGILLVDDFGRQKVSPKDLLNRWIVPLESEIDFISLATGRKLKVPFDVFVAFATNLNPADLVDDAFLRRVRYKIEVLRPDQSVFKSIFQSTCRSRQVPFDEQGFQFLMSLYERDRRPMNACEPRNLLAGIQSFADYFEIGPSLSRDLVERAYNAYFTRFAVE